MAHAKDFKPEGTIVELGNKKRKIKFDLNSYGELEKRFGSVQAAMDSLKEGNIGSLKVLLWAGLIHEEVVLDEFTGEPVKYNISPYIVGSWITPDMLQDISEKLGEAIGATLPEENKIETAKVAEAPKN